jgi:NADH-quinone oxidoreductase subunit J
VTAALVQLGAQLQLAAGSGTTRVDSTGEAVLFWILAPIMVLAAFGLVFARKAVHAALSMAIVMVNLGVVYLAQDAPFLGAVQVFVYTGAVMMLFLFVLMLVGVDSSDSLVETIKGQRFAAVLLGLGLGVLLMVVLSRPTYPVATGLKQVNDDGNVTALAAQIFNQYVWAFEVTSALLITAAMGAMVLAHRERLTPRATQRELSELRIRSGAVKAPLPAPGVYARHNAVDTPALLPDGTPSELSVSRVLTARGQMQSVSTRSGEVAAVLAEIANPLEPIRVPTDDERHDERDDEREDER